MATYFVAASGGNDANDGLDNIGVGLAGANWTESTFTLTETSHGYTFSSGDVIYISAGAGVTVGLYEVASSTANTIVLVETSTLPTVGNASDFAAGDLSGSDITSASGPKLTINGAEDIPVAAGDHVWIKSGTDYGEEVTIDVAGSADTSMITYRGYTTTLSDNGRFVIDGATRTTCITSSAAQDFRMFINMELKGATADLFVGATGTDRNTFRNCDFHDSVDGIPGNLNYFVCDRCIFRNLTGVGFYGGSEVQAIGCVFKNVTGIAAFRCNSGSFVGNLVFDVGASTKGVWIGASGTSLVAFNTLYGAKTTADTAIHVPSGTVRTVAIANNIITNWTTGVDISDDWTEGYNIGHNNVLFSNTTDYEVAGASTTKKFTHTGEQTADPSLTDPATDDYTIPNSGSAFGTGLTGFDTNGTDSNTNIGAFSPSGGGSGGLLAPNKRAYKQ